jgi:hypothetical protein
MVMRDRKFAPRKAWLPDHPRRLFSNLRCGRGNVYLAEEQAPPGRNMASLRWTHPATAEDAMKRDLLPADLVESATHHVSWRHHCGAMLSKAAGSGLSVLPGGGWDELTWAYARAFRQLEKAP